MKKRVGPPFMPPEEYGRALTGFMINIQVRDMDKAMEFHREVLNVDVIYSDPDISIVSWQGHQWMVHSDHTYDKHPLTSYIAGETSKRGLGAEFRLHGLDPDKAATAAEAIGCQILDAPRDQPDHGLREAHIIDFDGYVWVPDVPLPE